MQINFDLISDLHVETWTTKFDWSHQATSPYCIVVGDVSANIKVLRETLAHLGQCYQGVFYIDGNDEHRHMLTELDSSYNRITKAISNIPNVVYLQDNVVIINGVAILGTCGWWGWDFNPSLDYQKSVEWYLHRHQIPDHVADDIKQRSLHDTAYMVNSVKKLQTHKDVKSIVMVTHTMPDPRLVSHDIDLSDDFRFNTMGNAYMNLVFDVDTENKISTWCVGHYHKGVDQIIDGVRYVSHCRGRGDTPWKQEAYYPKRIIIDY